MTTREHDEPDDAARPDRDERRAAFAGASAFALFMASYYVLRALREEIGARDREHLELLWTGTFVFTLVIAPVYALIVSRFPRRVSIPIVFRIFVTVTLGFWAADMYAPESARIWVGRAFYIWVSTFNLFGPAVLWGLMADVFSNDQGKRLFGRIAAGASFGGIAGPLVAHILLQRLQTVGLPPLPAVHLLLLSAAMLEGAAQAVRWLNRLVRHRDGRRAALEPDGTDREGEPVRGGILAAVGEIARSPYLLGVCLYLFLYTFTSTVVYFETAHVAGEAFGRARDARTALFNDINLMVNCLAAVIQITLTARVVRRIGVAATLMIVPAVCAAGFLGLGLLPMLIVLVTFDVTRKATNFGLGKPAREVLFTVVSRRAKYQCKGVIDTAVYRGGDVTSGWIFTGLQAMGCTLGGIALIAVPVSAAWAGVGLWLGRSEERGAARRSP